MIALILLMKAMWQICVFILKEVFMSKLGYFLGGTVAGIAGLTIAALLHDHFTCSSSDSSTSALDDHDADETVDNSCATDASAASTENATNSEVEQPASEAVASSVFTEDSQNNQEAAATAPA
jgi:hypothetical protein